MCSRSTWRRRRTGRGCSPSPRREPASAPPRWPSCDAPQQLGQLLDSRRAREAAPVLVAQVAVAEATRLPARVQADERLADPLLVLGPDDDAGAGLAHELRRCTVGGHRGEDRPLGGEVLEDLPARYDLPAAGGVGEEQQVRLGVALQLERAPVR